MRLRPYQHVRQRTALPLIWVVRVEPTVVMACVVSSGRERRRPTW